MKESASENITTLVNDMGRYVETKAELWKLKAIDKTTDVASSLVAQILLYIIILIGIIALNIGIALLIGKWIGEAFYGFFIIAGFYFLLGIVMYLARNSLIKTPLLNAFINKLLK
ncbi:MAG: hypothetical protein M9933_14775 [Chitinophagaceae bacterium]|nr:hypothetical protein [Chitinophagaceae bacterium]